MKSKLFLSLSLLTAVFSMSADATTEVFEGPKNLGKLGRAAYAVSGKSSELFLANKFPTIVLPLVGCAAVAGYHYMQPKVEVKAPTYFERAKAQVQAGYNFAKINAVKGYESSVTFVKANPKSTAGAVAVVAALGYVAYKNSGAIFGNSKKAVTTTPVVKATPVRMHSKPFSRG